LTSSGQAPHPSLPVFARKLSRSAAPPLRRRSLRFAAGFKGFGPEYRSCSCRTTFLSCSLDHELCRLQSVITAYCFTLTKTAFAILSLFHNFCC